MGPEQKVNFNFEPKIGRFNGESILPPSYSGKEPTIDELCTLYPLRYKAYARAKGLEVNGKENGIPSDVLTRRLRMLNNLDRYITSHETPGQKKVLREKQMVVFKDIKEFLENGNTEGYVEAPTGFGKTVLFSEAINATDQTTVVAVPTRLLVKQTYKEFKRFNPKLDVGRVYSDKKEIGKKVIITTYATLGSPNSGINPQDIDLLILDEAHQSLTGPRIDAVGKFSNAIKLGFTATPEFSKDKRVDKLLNNEIHNITLKEAVETGLLSSFSVYLAETKVDLSNIHIAGNGDYDQKELEKAINIESRNKSAVELYQKLVEKNPDLSKCIVNCISIDHAKKVAGLFKDAGIGAETIYGTQNTNERDDIIKRYKEGELKVLTNVNVLTEGFDVPQASLAINLRPTLSPVVAKQRGGRILRLDPENLGKHAVIVDYLDKNEKKRNLQITFAQVAQGVRIINPAEANIKQQKERSQGEKEPKQPIIIDGLNVVTNTEEVLKVIKGIETEMKNDNKVTETDFILSESFLTQIFIGGHDKLLPIVSEVLKNLEKNSPDILQRKMSGTHHLTVVTNPDLFIQMMLDKGVKLKQSFDEIYAGDFATTFKNITKTFEGQTQKVAAIAKETLKELRVTNPDIFATRRNNNGYTQVITDAKPFIEAMLKKGIKLKIPISQKITGKNEIANTQADLRKHFVETGVAKLKAAADQVFEEIKNENPQMIIERRHGSNRITVATDIDEVNKRMRERGFRPRDESIKEIQPDDFSTVQYNLRTFFVGSTTQLSKVAHDIINSLGERSPELIAKRKSTKGGKVRFINVVTDRELFIKLMEEKGIKKRQNISGDIFP